MKQEYKALKLGKKTLVVIDQVNDIIETYQEQGYILTLRQLYYQMVSRALVSNDKQSYKRLGDAVGKGRLAGRIDWDAIVDRTRVVRSPGYWRSPQHIMSAMERSYKLDKWPDQEYAPQVWIEKDALVGVVQRPCDQAEIPYLALRGYPSLSVIRERALGMSWEIHDGRTPYIIHLGDHDPSGIDMSRDLEDRLDMFLSDEGYTLDDWRFVRIALNMDQVKQYDPPPFFAKITDSRSADYISQYGNDSWELDALEPSVIEQLITDELEKIVDFEKWQPIQDREDKEKAMLKKISANYADVVEFVGNIKGGDAAQK